MVVPPPRATRTVTTLPYPTLFRSLHAMCEHVVVIGLAYDDIKPAELRTFLEKHPVVYPIAVVDVYDPPADFATPRGLPMTYMIAPGGKVYKQVLGPVAAKDIEGPRISAARPAGDAAPPTAGRALGATRLAAADMAGGPGR